MSCMQGPRAEGRDAGAGLPRLAAGDAQGGAAAAVWRQQVHDVPVDLPRCSTALCACNKVMLQACMHLARTCQRFTACPGPGHGNA